MGDKIRLQLEAMLPEILVFVKRKIFTKEEVNIIMKEREQNEYLLERKNASVKDYLKVIEYEYDLEKKRRKRFKALNIKKESQKDFAIIRRILQLWDKITYRNRYRVDIWKQYLSFCYFIQSKKSFFKVVSAALRFNPYNLDLWLLAAYYESEINSNPFKGRKIFYKALKINQKQLVFWIEYFKYEVKFIEKVMTRQLLISKDIDAVKEKDLEAASDFMGFEEVNKKQDVLLELDNINAEDQTQMLTVLKQVYLLAKEQFKATELGFQLFPVLDDEKSKWLTPIKEQIIQDIQNEIAEEKEEQTKSDLQGQLLIALNGFNENHLPKFELKDLLNNLCQSIEEKGENKESSISYLIQMLVKNKSKINIDIAKEVKNAQRLIHIVSSMELKGETLKRISEFIISFEIIEENILKNILQAIKEAEEASPTNQSEDLFLKKIDILCLLGQSEDAIKYLRVRLQKIHSSSSDKKYSLLKKYLEIKKQNPLSFKEINIESFLSLCQEHLLLHKDIFQTIIQDLYNYIAKTNNEYLSIIIKRLLSYKQLCPLQIYLSYISSIQQDKKKSSEVKQLWSTVSQWYQTDLSMWKNYFIWQRDIGGVQDCPRLLEKASKSSGIEYHSLIETYNAVINE